MSDNIYNILNNFNKVAQEPQKPATQSQPKAKTQLQESMDHVLAKKYAGFKKTVAEDQLDELSSDTLKSYLQKSKGRAGEFQKQGDSTDNEKKADKFYDKRDSVTTARKGARDRLKGVFHPKQAPYGMKDVAEGEVEESGLQAYLGNKKYGKEGMDALRKAGREGASKEKMAKIRAKHDKMDEATKPDYIDLDKDGNKTEPMKKAAKDAKSKKVQEVAPPGAKAERMVKHIKKGYAKDGKLTKTEKSKAYGAAWKAHNKGKVEEAIKAMYEAGFTKEQIIEGWDDMLKAVEKRSKDKGTGKFDKKQISTGTVYTRKYDPKTGETDDSENVTAVKRGRGRPKKSTFESATTANKMIVEHFREFIEGSIQGGVWTSNPPKKGQPNVPVPQDIDGGSVRPTPKTPTPKPSTPPMGSIKGGVWTAEPPKPGEKGVPVPQNPEVAKEGEMADAMASVANNLANRLGDKGRAGASVANNLTNNLANRLGDKVRAGASVANNLTNRLSDKDKSQDNPNTNGYDLEVAKEGDMEEGNEFSGALDNARDAGEKTFKVNGKTYPVKEGQELLQMLRIAGIKVMEDAKVDEDDMEEGNEFSGALDNARDAGEKTFKVNGKTYPVKEDAQLEECGMSPMGNGMMGQEEQEGKMNVNTNMDSDGHKSVTISAEGNAALELMQMLKLAGMGGADHGEENTHGEPEGVMVVSAGDEEEVEENLKVVPNPSTATSVDQAKKLGSMMPAPPGEKDPIATKEAKDERYHANTTPEEHVMPVQVQTKGGNGDVAGREKKMTPHGYQFGDNPQAMKESMSLKLIKEYEAIKVKK